MSVATTTGSAKGSLVLMTDMLFQNNTLTAAAPWKVIEGAAGGVQLDRLQCVAINSSVFEQNAGNCPTVTTGALAVMSLSEEAEDLEEGLALSTAFCPAIYTTHTAQCRAMRLTTTCT